MKSGKLWTGILVLVFGMTVVGCATVSTDTPVGSWTNTQEFYEGISLTSTYIINADGSYSTTSNGFPGETGSWVVLGRTVTFTRSDKGVRIRYTATINGDKMTVHDPTEDFTLTKQ